MSEADKETVDGADFAVGFRRPPLHTRFKPGVSGNPSGRPKDSKNLKTLLHAILNEQISLQEGSQSRKVSKAGGNHAPPHHRSTERRLPGPSCAVSVGRANRAISGPLH